MKLEYFRAHGRAQQIRLILNYCKVEFEDVYLTREEFEANKLANKYNNGHVPCLFLDDGTQLNETHAIMRYLCRTLKNPDVENCRMYPLANADTHMLIYKMEHWVETNKELYFKYICFLLPSDPGYEEKDKHFTLFITKYFPDYLQQMEDILAEAENNGHEYLFGNQLTLPDFSTASIFFKLVVNELF